MTNRVWLSAIRAHIFSSVVFLLPALALTVRIGVGIIEAVLLVGTIVLAKPLWSQRSELFRGTGWIIAAFVLNLAIAIVSTPWAGFSFHFLDNPIRQVLVVTAIGLVALTRPNAKLFWHGLFVGTLGAACFAVYQRFAMDLARAEGVHMAIMFGDIAMAMGLMSLASIQQFSKTRFAFLPYVAFLLGLSASILSGSRGGWIALLFSFIPLYSYGQRAMRRGILSIVAISIALFAVACFVPNLNVRERLVDVSTEIHQYQLGNAGTSVGARLEMWKGAWALFTEHPLAGVGRANFNQGLNDLIVRGEINPAIHDFHHAHNEMLNALATEGLAGGLALFLLYAAPLVFFMHALKRNNAAQSYALAGLLLVLSFIDFGLTQVMFSHHIGSAFYALGVSVLAGLCVMIERGRNN